MRAAAIVFLLGSALPVTGQELIPVPSGQAVTLQDVILNQPGPMGLSARFRFIAPAIAREGGTIPFETASADMEYLCNSFALPRVTTGTGPLPEQIIVSLSDIPVTFGEITPDATQFFEAFSIEGDACLWEQF
ncbi:DUF6497 family protein [Falsigemmobacter intermedius]|uniref:Acetolactate synthase n=1 Tax=Falsigemmobacter intermedius TaxID=1553448 RepID=A0A444MCG5_9RHOB|nr:DUF6497 family protein [Falsigemmobacter intermedius]RWY41706.1 acetolactate synthase [Falsigemmobacter intermedius]